MVKKVPADQKLVTLGVYGGRPLDNFEIQTIWNAFLTSFNIQQKSISFNLGVLSQVDVVISLF